MQIQNILLISRFHINFLLRRAQVAKFDSHLCQSVVALKNLIQSRLFSGIMLNYMFSLHLQEIDIFVCIDHENSYYEYLFNTFILKNEFHDFKN